ncbi:MAG: hypothetical protein AAGC56_14915 [Pseudomonadota bacterium]
MSVYQLFAVAEALEIYPAWTLLVDPDRDVGAGEATADGLQRIERRLALLEIRADKIPTQMRTVLARFFGVKDGDPPMH